MAAASREGVHAGVGLPAREPAAGGAAPAAPARGGRTTRVPARPRWRRRTVPRRAGNGRSHPGWACYHTDMWVTAAPSSDLTQPPMEIGVVGDAVGASFAVLVAGQLHASGTGLVIKPGC